MMAKEQLIFHTEKMKKISHPVVDEISKSLLGKELQIALTYACFLADGHVLLEDVPGVGKTTLAHAFASVLNLPFRRIQCTSDLLPSDITGASIWSPKTENFMFMQGPLFTNIVVADEINRAPSKTQSAMLEAMEEKQVTIEGNTMELPKPFWVIATQNPDDPGTNTLPDSQLDRFLIKVSLGYPDERYEKELLRRRPTEQRHRQTHSLWIDIAQEKKNVENIQVSDAVVDYTYRLVSMTRNKIAFKKGLSPRAAQGVMALARAWAFLQNSKYVMPEHIQDVFVHVAAHRCLSTNGSTIKALREIIDTTAI